MFDHTSRYAALDTASHILPDGRAVTYARRRFLPPGASLPTLTLVNVVPGDRIDLLANRVYGDPLMFWRLCDANDAMDPLQMLADAAGDPSAALRAAMPQT
ncbi:hypothetical protein [Caulobacter sp. UNC279MFTsu5.1]|uniref:hypothetical protein n=1 Tax=Caulobacter sp. UNC279MFTsu5.1 TaxID=1502775 RepID=UPI000379BAF5|nr:hypothetical protein [Caulobacter sp. UNC279MFTsu5.1]SFK62127.1 hypothetical protein SAMN02799626_04753 [Caulobacter sp. UNC279MFTsu5.1]